MTINIGTANIVKIKGLKETIDGYDFLRGALVAAVAVKSRVADQPKSLDETIRGAKNRARGAFNDCDLSIGIEDGLMAVRCAATGFMNVCVAAIYDGKRYHLGLSAAFEYPPEAIALVKKGFDINQAFYKMKLTENPQIGADKGAIGILTKDRWQRIDTIKQAIVAALIQLENKKLYK